MKGANTTVVVKAIAHESPYMYTVGDWGICASLTCLVILHKEKQINERGVGELADGDIVALGYGDKKGRIN